MGAIVWLIGAVVLAGLELAVGEFTFLMLAAGALTTSGAALFGLPLWAEVAVFAATSAAFWVFLRPYLHRRFLTPGAYNDSPRTLVGSRAEVIEDITPGGGQIRLDGTIWSARALDPAVRIASGEHVTVSDIDGPVAVVWKDN
ncbi:NfeD family protein [Corynebacterium timonense]|uniref:Membrane protein implicated in regulation of membrane protease activity n=1 Tax=Corynebacterium timonense TaxID=441500 RepID=A0A1H1P2L3_9CORY|nr:NfeD family protein [Corynebacterium timonense]SDS05506.1 Membrane protein implicated in regulation of membrane protease activity [Corynebacterium timonense]